MLLALIVGQGDKDLVEVTVDTDGEAGGDTGTVVATDGHPFWVENQGAWVDAKDLRLGDMLRTSAGTWVQVTTTREFQRHQQVHNLTVADVHTYHVTAGSIQVLVHNVNEARLCDMTMGPGPFAKECVALPGGNKDAPRVQGLINESGARNGCHTCGASSPGTKSGNWITDHQHPTALGSGYQTGYPQCNPRRYEQGGMVRALKAEQYSFPSLPRLRR